MYEGSNKNHCDDKSIQSKQKKRWDIPFCIEIVKVMTLMSILEYQTTSVVISWRWAFDTTGIDPYLTE